MESEISRDFIDNYFNQEDESLEKGGVVLIPTKQEFIEIENYPDYMFGIIEKVIRYSEEPLYEEMANPSVVCYAKELPEFELDIEHQNKVKDAIQENNLPVKPIKTYIVKYLR